MTRMTFTGTIACPGCKDGRLNCLVHRPLPDQMRIVILGGPKTGKTTLANHLALGGTFTDGRTGPGRTRGPGAKAVRHTDDLIHLGWSEASQHVADEWLNAPGPWIIEGVAVARALRKWRDAHPGEPPPVDRVIRLTVPHVALTPGQRTMTRGEETVWREVEQWLLSADGIAVEEHGGSSAHIAG